MSGLLSTLGKSAGRRRRERRAESKYDYNYDDRALDYREEVAARREMDPSAVRDAMRWHLFDNGRFWDERYYIPPDRSVEDAAYDAYNDFDAAYPHIEPYLDNVDGLRILVIGCGTSQIARKLAKLGHCSIVNADLSQQLVQRMLTPEEIVEGVDVVCADATNMYMYPDGWFDLIVDKALLDTLFTRTTMMTDVPAMIDEMSRLLAPGGTYLIFSTGPPPARQDYLERKPLHWRVRCGKSTQGIFTYACTQPINESAAMHYLE